MEKSRTWHRGLAMRTSSHPRIHAAPAGPYQEAAEPLSISLAFGLRVSMILYPPSFHPFA